MADSPREIDAHIRFRLHTRYSIKNGWFMLEEVTVHGHKRRRIDAVAVGMRDKNSDVHGFEIKTTRADWLSELDDLDKSAAALERVEYFWVVAPKGVVKIEELPTGWGLMHPTKTQIRVDRRADHTGAEGLDEFSIELIRKQRNVMLNEHNSTWSEAWHRGFERAKVEVERRSERQDERALELEKILHEEQLSVDLVRRSAPLIKAMDKISGRSWLSIDQQIATVRRCLNSAGTQIEAAQSRLADAVEEAIGRESAA